MSTTFRAVQWNRAKLVYDAILLAGVTLYIGGYLTAVYWVEPPKDLPAAIHLLIRASGTCAFLMLSITLSIGPLARLDRRFLLLLYNRRHFGVLTFVVALLHASFMVEWHVVQQALPSLFDELTRISDYGKFIGFPFKALGLTALLILFLMAATSHDYWLVFLTPSVWKSLHMAGYAAYGLIVMHVALGVMQNDRNPFIPALLGSSFACVTLLHLLAGWRERTSDRAGACGSECWLTVGPPLSIPDKGARIVATPGGERIAVFRDGAQIGALSNLCVHQNGPIGEGCIIDGYVTCPWHGYQYRLADGCAPLPFTEKLVTYRVRVAHGVVEVDPRPLPPGTPAAISWMAVRRSGQEGAGVSAHWGKPEALDGGF